VLSSEDGGIPLVRFASDYYRMTKTQFPWKEHGFISARDMLVSMESTVEFKYCEKENQFYLVPAAQNSVDNSFVHCEPKDSLSAINTPLRTEQSSCVVNGTSVHNDTSDVPLLVEDTSLTKGGGVYEIDHLGRVSVYVTQTKDKPPVKNFWNVRITCYRE